MPLTTKRETLSGSVIMSSVMGSQTFSENPSRPRTCTTTPSYMQVAQCKDQRLRWKGPNIHHHHRLQRPRKKGNILTRKLWQKRTKSFQNMHVVITDAKSYVTKTPERCLHEAAKAEKYLPIGLPSATPTFFDLGCLS